MLLCSLIWIPAVADSQENQEPDASAIEQTQPKPRIINDIIIVGNNFTPRDAMLNYIPYQVGEIFNPQKSAVLIRNLYTELKRFRNITLKGDLVGDDRINLYIVVEEKTPLKDIIFKGNKNLKEGEIRKKVTFDSPAVDPEELKVFIEQIKKIYYEKGFQNVAISTDLSIDDDGKAIAIFDINEGQKSRIRRILFEGNEHISDKDLRNVLFTKEEWPLSFMDKTGTFHPERLEADKHMVEQHYQNKGYLHAKIIDVRIEPEPNTNILIITFVIEEGDRYTISEVKAPGNDIVSQEFLLANIPIRPGQYYSREMIANTIKMMEFLWGNLGYIFASIEPSVQPDEDNKTIALSFMSDIGKQITLNRITIKGNKKTRDKVIRRRIALKEGGLLTQGQMEMSKSAVTSLGFFEQQDGVNWKIRRRNEEEADLDLFVKESKTGSANIQLGFGGAGASLTSPASGFNVKGSITDTNLFGSGTNVNLEASWSKDEQTLVFHLAQPWLFDKPISGAMDIYHKRPSFDQLRYVMGAINSKVTGGGITAGFITSPHWKILGNTQALFSVGIDSVSYNKPPAISIPQQDLPRGVTQERAFLDYSNILIKEFTPGEYVWLANYLEQDQRNHPIHTSRGHKWKIVSKVAIPSFDREGSGMTGDATTRKNGFAKLFLDYTWYNPLIGEQDLVFKLHLFFGIATPLSGRSIPFNELFHIGGDTTVRGFSYGQIGPKFLQTSDYPGDTIGAKKAFYINAELIFPITQDMSMKAVAFYDGGAGWDNPYVCNAAPGLISDNKFNYRHSVGVGIRLLRPMPIRVDWGFKLDPRNGERESEVHFGMTYDW